MADESKPHVITLRFPAFIKAEHEDLTPEDVVKLFLQNIAGAEHEVEDTDQELVGRIEICDYSPEYMHAQVQAVEAPKASTPVDGAQPSDSTAGE